MHTHTKQGHVTVSTKLQSTVLTLNKNEKNIFKTIKEVGMLLQKIANTSGVGISNIMRKSIYTGNNHTLLVHIYKESGYNHI